MGGAGERVRQRNLAAAREAHLDYLRERAEQAASFHAVRWRDGALPEDLRRCFRQEL